MGFETDTYKIQDLLKPDCRPLPVTVVNIIRTFIDVDTSFSITIIPVGATTVERALAVCTFCVHMAIMQILFTFVNVQTRCTVTREPGMTFATKAALIIDAIRICITVFQVFNTFVDVRARKSVSRVSVRAKALK